MIEFDVFVVDPAEESFVGFFNGCGCGALDLTARENIGGDEMKVK